MGAALLACCREPLPLEAKDCSYENELGNDGVCNNEALTLTRLLRSRPFLDKKTHVLHQYVKETKEKIAAGDQSGAENALITLDLEIKAEEHTIAAAFQKFDHSGDGVLQGDEIKFMLDYLGFPCAPKDIKDLMRVVDTDNDDTVSYDEFIFYVGNLGGSDVLFELRRAQIEDRSKGSPVKGKLDKETVKTGLAAVGITDENLAYWQLTANPSELEEASQLRPSQRLAVRHIRNLARESHAKALPELKNRVTRLGFTEVDLHMALAWVRELAPMIVHVNLEKLGEFLLKDSHYRNQFETNSSGGLLKPAARVKWERGLFGTAYNEETPGSERPKYGVQNIWNDYRGVIGCKQYGDSYLVLKDVRLRCTMSPEDSANLPAKRLAVPDYYAHVLMEYSDKELKETLRVAKGGDEKLGDSMAVIEQWGKYKEVQIHGEVSLDRHVERLVVPDRLKEKQAWVQKIAKAHKWKLTWMKDMQAELKSRAGGREMDQKTWQGKLDCLRKEEETTRLATRFVKAREILVRWSFQVQSGWQPFDRHCQEPLEAMFKEYKASPSEKTAIRELKVRNGIVMIDFEQMTQKVKGYSRTRKLQRVDL
mmetsp:Transcript_62470/g.167100  ORF Transcript_62470/g.167100 Transcript_62470/m.167100 type:complete len:594 (-) Transcript_62470:134-1915(-)